MSAHRTSLRPNVPGRYPARSGSLESRLLTNLIHFPPFERFQLIHETRDGVRSPRGVPVPAAAVSLPLAQRDVALHEH